MLNGQTFFRSLSLQERAAQHSQPARSCARIVLIEVHQDNPSAKVQLQLDYSELYHARNIPGTEKGESIEDKRFSNILTTGIHKNDLANWDMPLPFKTDTVSLPNNHEQCLKRLLGTEFMQTSLTEIMSVLSHQRNLRPKQAKSGFFRILTSTIQRNLTRFG